jgi:hypothetical protein
MNEPISAFSGNLWTRSTTAAFIPSVVGGTTVPYLFTNEAKGISYFADNSSFMYPSE